MNELTTVYEITSATNEFLMPAGLLLAISLVVLTLVFKGYLRFNNEMDLLKTFLVWIFIVGFSLIIFTVGSPETDYLLDVYREGKCEITEGIVHVTKYERPHRNGDNISLNGKTFELNYYSGTPGYQQTISHGGALLEGVYARLHHYKGMILKVEVKGQPGSRPYYPWSDDLAG